MSNEKQLYLSQPCQTPSLSDPNFGKYEVAKYSSVKDEYIPIEGTQSSTQATTERIAMELNMADMIANALKKLADKLNEEDEIAGDLKMFADALNKEVDFFASKLNILADVLNILASELKKLASELKKEKIRAIELNILASALNILASELKKEE